MRRLFAYLTFVVVLLGARYALGDVSALVRFNGIMPASLSKVEVLRDGVPTDVTAAYFPCQLDWCAVVAQPVVTGSYSYTVRVTDTIGRVSPQSNVKVLVIPAPPTAPNCVSAQLVLSTGTPTPAATITPTP